MFELLSRTNMSDTEGRSYTQEIQLSGAPGNYGFWHMLQAKTHPGVSRLTTDTCHEGPAHVSCLNATLTFVRRASFTLWRLV